MIGRDEHPRHDEALRRIEAGERQKDIADDLGLNRATVQRWVRAAGYPPRTRGKYSTEVRDEAVKRIEEGEAQTAVAADLGIPYPTVNDWLEMK